MTPTYTLSHLTVEHCRVLVSALDLFSRTHIGQFDEILRIYRADGRALHTLSPSEQNEVRALIGVVHDMLTGMPRNASYSILAHEVPDEARVAWDLQQLVRHRVAWDAHPEGGIQVDFDEPRRSSHELPLPVIERAIVTLERGP